MKLGAEIAAAEQLCQSRVARNQTKASACQELPKKDYVPENDHTLTLLEHALGN